MGQMPFKSVSEAAEYYQDLSRKAVLFALGLGLVIGFLAGLLVKFP